MGYWLFISKICKTKMAVFRRAASFSKASQKVISVDDVGRGGVESSLSNDKQHSKFQNGL